VDAELARRRAVFAVASAGEVLARLDLLIASVAPASIRRGLHGSIRALSWVLNGYSIAFAAGLVPGGRLADRDGRKGTFVVGVALFDAHWTRRSSSSRSCSMIRLTTSVHGMRAGADGIDDMDRLRSGATGLVPGYSVMAPRRWGRSCAPSPSAARASSAANRRQPHARTPTTSCTAA